MIDMEYFSVAAYGAGIVLEGVDGDTRYRFYPTEEEAKKAQGESKIGKYSAPIKMDDGPVFDPEWKHGAFRLGDFFPQSKHGDKFLWAIERIKEIP